MKERKTIYFIPIIDFHMAAWTSMIPIANGKYEILSNNIIWVFSITFIALNIWNDY
jgi:hypothetical protein